MIAGRRCVFGVVGLIRRICRSSRESETVDIVEGLERTGTEGITPVDEISAALDDHPK